MEPTEKAANCKVELKEHLTVLASQKQGVHNRLVQVVHTTTNCKLMAVAHRTVSSEDLMDESRAVKQKYINKLTNNIS